jgi:hypothetical protein
MLPSPLEANFVHHEDFELARSAKWELMQLRSRSTKPTADDVMLIARKAGLAEFLQHASRTTVDVVRADAWLAICTLADSIAKCPSSNGLGQSAMFRDGGSGSLGLEFRRLSTDVAIVAV